MFIPPKDEVLIGGLVFLKDWIIRSETSNALGKLIIRNPISGEEKILDFIPNKNANYLTNSNAPFRLLNIGNNNPVKLEEFIEILEHKCKKKAIKTYLPMQQGDVEETFADIDDLSKLTGFSPKTTLSEGLGRFVDWYKKYYEIE